MLIPGSEPWRFQPFYPVEIDWSHPFTDKLSFLFIGSGGPFDVVGNRSLTTDRPDAFKPGMDGIAFARDVVTTSCYIQTPNNPTWLQSDPITCFAFGLSDPLATNSGFMIARAMGTAAPSFGVGIWRGSADGVVHWANGVTADLTPSTPHYAISDAILNSTPQFLVQTIENGVATLYVNGIERHSVSGLGAIDFSRTDQPLYIGRSGSSGQFRGNIYLAGVINKRVAPEVIRAIADNVWQIFSRRYVIFLPAVGVSMPVLSAPSFVGRVPSVTITY